MTEKIKPFPFQEIGIDFLLNKQRACLFDEMGLGKTIQTLFAVKHMSRSECLKVLVIAPASLTLMWEKAVNEIITDKQIIKLKGIKEAIKLEDGKTRFVIVSYNYIQKDEQSSRLAKVKWDCILCDEATALKNWTSKTTKGLRKIVSNLTGRLWLLTGTPATKSARDYYTFLNLVEPGKWGNLSEFTSMFCVETFNPFTGYWQYDGVKPEKRKILRAAFKKISLRRLKADVLKELPDKVYSDITIEVDASIVKECKAIDKKGFERAIETNKFSEHIMSLMKQIGLAKTKEIVRFVSEFQGPIVIFCMNTDVLEVLDNELKGLKLCKRITGKEKKEEKDQNLGFFQDGVIDVLLVNIQAGGMGLTMTRADTCVFAQLSWSPKDMRQCEDRLHRIGQKNAVNVVRFIGKDTLDEDIIARLEYKEKFMKEVMGDTK